jgi:hypothetical protein
MNREPLTIQIDPDSEVARVLAGAGEVPVVLDSNGVRYTVNREPTDLLAGYSPQRARNALRQSSGAFKGMDIEALKQELRAQRAQYSHGRP